MIAGVVAGLLAGVGLTFFAMRRHSDGADAASTIPAKVSNILAFNNQVRFDAAKESKHVLHRRKPQGESFKILGALWDTKLAVAQQCHEVARRAGWKLKTLLKTKRDYNITLFVV